MAPVYESRTNMNWSLYMYVFTYVLHLYIYTSREASAINWHDLYDGAIVLRTPVKSVPPGEPERGRPWQRLPFATIQEVELAYADWRFKRI